MLIICFKLKVKDYIPNYFDLGDYRIIIENAINNLMHELLLNYEQKMLDP